MTTNTFEDIFPTIHKILATEYRILEKIIPDLPTNNDPPRIVFVGTSAVGKSSIVNRILRYELSPINLVATDHRITRSAIWLNLFNLVDTFGFFGDSAVESLLSDIRRASVIVQVCDVEATVRRSDRQLKAYIDQFEKPYIAVLNKTDLHKHEKKKLARLTERAKSALRSDILLISAREQNGLDTLIYKVHEILPELEGQELYSRLCDLQTRIKIEVLYQRQRILFDKIIAKYSHDAAKLGAGKTSAGAQLLTLHRKMIHEIAEQVTTDSQAIEFPTTYTFDSRLEFFIHAVVQEVTPLIPTTGKSIASTHAVVWTDKIGKLAVAYFSQQITNEEVEVYVKKELQI